MTAFLRDLIHIPESVSQGDFVLKLTEGTDETRAGATLREYVVTPQLAECFDQALKLVQSAVQGQTSKAAYLHGSFGSGKSHFMAVLHFLLQGNTEARSIPELGDVVVRHKPWMDGRKFLMVPFHLLAAKDFETALFEGYARHIERHFPDAPTPGLFRSAELLRNAASLRESMGDERFFARLNEGRSAAGGTGGGWGKLSVKWDAASFQEAAGAAPTDTRLRTLVGDLVETHLTAARSGTEFVSIDDGLAIMSAHAKELGFDGVILFLDELILWLASHAGNVDFVSREAQKLPKLVEYSNAVRPVPIISFVARQRDLRELVGQHIAGAEKLGFFDTLSYHEGRFAVIRLEDRNLPAITEKRVLRPLNDEAKKRIDAEFERTAALRDEVQKVLMTSRSNREDFRRLYPFSPALVDTLVAVSSLLQRERTALKIMMQLLVRGRDTLQLGQIIPVGDLFDEIAEGDDAFNSVMKAHFDEARKLYNQHLRPMLEDGNKLTFEDSASLPVTDPRRQALKNDDRFIKTLLLAALAPQVESLQNMTPQRLSALNHGAIKAFIPGQEAQTVLKKCRDWASVAGQIQIHEGAGGIFTISIRISGVDINSILERAEAVDNYGNRVARVKNLLFDSLGVNGYDQVLLRHSFRWKGTDREADIQFGNIREMDDEMFESRGGNWRVLIDYPFDREGHSVHEDENRINTYRGTRPAAQTIAWLPSFLNFEAQRDIGKLLRLEHILDPNRFRTFVDHLSEVDQAGARTQMENMKGQLVSRIQSQVEAVYGLREAQPDYVDQGNHLRGSEHFLSLEPSLEPRPPVAASLREALNGLLDQALRHQFPAHPEFDDELKVTKASAAKVLEVVKAAVNSKEPSVVVTDQALRKLTRQIANPLKVGQMADQRFQLERDYWRNHFSQREARHPGEPVTVERLREWMDEPRPQGLPVILQDFIILAWALQTNRGFIHGVPVPAPAPGELDPAMVLKEQLLPEPDEWKNAGVRAKSIFGVEAAVLINASNVESFARTIREKTDERLPDCQRLEQEIGGVMSRLQMRESGCQRLATAMEAAALLLALHKSKDATSLVKRLAAQPLQAKPMVVGTCVQSAAAVAPVLTSLPGRLFPRLEDLRDERQEQASRILDDLKSAIKADEYVISLKERVSELEGRALNLLTAPVSAPASHVPAEFPAAPPPEPVPAVKPPPLTSASQRVKQSQLLGDTLPEWVPEAYRSACLVTVRVPGPDDHARSIVVSATVARLIEAAGDARISDDGTRLLFKSWKCEVSLTNLKETR